MRDSALPAAGVGEDGGDLVLALRDIAERQLERPRRLLAVDLNLAAAIERDPVGHDGEATVVGTRLDPGANFHSGGSEREGRRNGDRQRLPSIQGQHGGYYQSTDGKYSSHGSGPPLLQRGNRCAIRWV